MEIKANNEIKFDINKLIKQRFHFTNKEIERIEKEKEEKFKKLSLQYEEERKRNKAKKYKDISIVDNKFYKSTFEVAEESEIIAMLHKYCNNFIKTGTAPTGLYIHGTVGNGKTYAVSCLANKLLEHGKGVLFMNFALYLNKLRASYKDDDDNSVEKDILNYVKQCDLLIIDDLGVESVKPFVKEKLFNLIDTRYRTDKPMIVTSNLTLEEIKVTFGDRVADRLRGCTYDFLVKGES